MPKYLSMLRKNLDLSNSFFELKMLVYFDLLEPEGEVKKELSMKKYIIYICCGYLGWSC